MDIKNIDDIKKIVDEMHDSEFDAEDFGFNADKKIFYLKSHSAQNDSEEFYVHFYNVQKYNAVNLDKVNIGKATAGVFGDIKIRDNGLTLEILSQDLRILLKLNKLEGTFEKKSKNIKI